MPSTTLNLGRVKGSMWYTGTADSNVDIASALTSAGYTPIKLDMYLNTSNGNVYQYAPVDDGLQWTLKGNLRGAKGEGFQIKKTYESVSAMNAGYATDGLAVGSFVMISSNVDDPDNAKLYVKGETAYTFVTDFSGAQGIKGDTGDKGDKGDTGTAATVSVGTVTTGAAGSQASVTNVGNANAAVLNFSIPKGDKGDKGDTGDTGDAATIQVGSVTSGAAGSQPQVTNGGTAQAVVLNFVIPKGDKGDKGDTGDKGDDGKTPTFTVNANGELIATFE